MPQPRWLRLVWLSASVILGGDHVWGSESPQTAEQAAQAMRAGNFEEAVRLYRSLCSEYPADPSLHLSLAAALHSAGHYPEALRQLEPIRLSQKRNAKFWFLLGVTELKLGDAFKAVEPLRRSVELDPVNDEARLELASTLLEAHQLAAAESQYRRLAQTLPKSTKVWKGLALSETALSGEALDALKKAAPRSSYLYGLAAVAGAESGNTADAIALYQKAAAASPEASWMGRELAALQNGESPPRCDDPTYACRFFNGDGPALASELARLRTPEALYWTTRIYSQLAQRSIETLAALPPSPEQHELMARLYAQNGRKAEAIEELREAVKLSPEDPLAAGDLAEALWADRQYDESVALLSRLVEAAPGRADWQFELGDALFNVGKPEEGILHLNKAVELSPGLLPAHAKLGEALLRTGDAAGAVSHLERAESIDRDGSIHFQLAAAYRKLGNMAAASKAMERRTELANGFKETAGRSPAKQ